MRANYMLILVFYLYTLINTNPFIQYTYDFNVLHEKSETPKVWQLNNGDVLSISSGLDKDQITNIAKFDKDGYKLYEKFQLLNGYSPSSLVVES